MTGHTSCIMKKNEDGEWLWLVDNPFGSAVLKGSNMV
jgi:ketosteroid isomerase-like protein